MTRVFWTTVIEERLGVLQVRKTDGVNTNSPDVLAAPVARRHPVRAQPQRLAAEFLNDWQKRGIVEQPFPGRYRMSDRGRAMLGGWTTGIRLEDEEPVTRRIGFARGRVAEMLSVPRVGRESTRAAGRSRTSDSGRWVQILRGDVEGGARADQDRRRAGVPKAPTGV